MFSVSYDPPTVKARSIISLTIWTPSGPKSSAVTEIIRFSLDKRVKILLMNIIWQQIIAKRGLRFELRQKNHNLNFKAIMYGSFSMGKSFFLKKPEVSYKQQVGSFLFSGGLMKNKIMCVVGIFCALGISYALQYAWQTPDQRIDTDDFAYGENPAVISICSDGDNVYVAWVDERWGDFDIFFNSSWDGGLTWQPKDIRLDVGSPPGSSQSSSIQLVCNKNIVCAAWIDDRNGRFDIYVNRSEDRGQTWFSTDSKVIHGDAIGSCFFSQFDICMSGDSIFVVWAAYTPGYSTDIYFNFSHDGGHTWLPIPMRLNDFHPSSIWGSNDPQICCSGNNLYVSWSDKVNGCTDIYFRCSRNFGETWEQAFRLDLGTSEGESDSFDVKMCCDGDYIYIAWLDWRNWEYDIYFNSSSDGGRTWQPQDVRLDVSDVPSTSSQDCALCCSGQNVYVAWLDNRASIVATEEVYFNRSLDGGVHWEPAEINLSNNPVAFQFTMDLDIACDGENVFVVWSDFRNSYTPDIFANWSYNAGATWQPEEARLDTGDPPGASGSSGPHISCSGTGRVHAAYSDERNGHDDIYHNWMDYPSTLRTLNLTRDKGGDTVPAAGQYAYPRGALIKLAAAADEGYEFAGWTGDVPAGYGNKNPLRVTMGRDRAIHAVFNHAQCRLTLQAGEGGTTDPIPGLSTHRWGQQVILTAVPAAGYRFAGWTGDVSSTENPLTLTMDGHKTIKAFFTAVRTLTIDASSGGTTNPPPGTYIYDLGSRVMLTALPQEHYFCTGWRGDVTASKNRILLIMDRDYTVNATFLRLIYQPLGVQGMKIHNRSLSQSEYINILCWSPHPDNIDINSYRIFSIIDSARSLVAEVSPSSREYQHRHVPKNISYIYEIRAVNREGREGLPARVTIQ